MWCVRIYLMTFAHQNMTLPQVVDLSLDVNVEFMLCPTAAMYTIFKLVPAWIIWPSYRTTLTLAVMIVAPPLSYTYIIVARVLRMAFGASSVKKSAVKVK